MQYKFDYIKEIADKWGEGVPRDLHMLLNTPYEIRLPVSSINESGKIEYTPPYDYYGEPIEDIKEWLQQRADYCKWLEKEYKKIK